MAIISGGKSLRKQGDNTPLIVNGDMAVAQRGTSSTSDGIATCDRWNVRKTSLDNLALTQAQSTTVPGHGFKNSFKYDTTTVETALASDEALAIETRIEANSMQALKYGTSQAETATLTFWVRGSLTGVHGIYIRTHDGAQEFVQSYNITDADTWQKVAINIPANTAKVINNDNGIGWWIQWVLAAGTDIDGASLGAWHDNATEIAPASQVNYMANTSYEFYLTGVQLEIGTYTATTTPAFPFESFGDNLKRCERYYEVIVDANDGIGLQVVGITGHTYKVDQINMPVQFKTEKRANSPSLEFVSGAYYEMRTHSTTVTTSSMGVTGAQCGKQNAVPYFNTSSQTEHEGWTMYVQNAAAHIAFSSEL
mgnify:CR=1 FL=1